MPFLQTPVRRSRCALLLAAVLAAGGATPLLADDAAPQPPTAHDMVQQLKPKPATRGIVIGGMAAPVQPPSIDLAVNFEFNSAALAADAALTLDRLGDALNDPALASCRFRIAGHTDAAGRDDYNRRLSERRAAAVRDYLLQRHGIDPQRLSAVGFGSSRLLDPGHPTSAVNRRVEITNLGTDPGANPGNGG